MQIRNTSKHKELLVSLSIVGAVLVIIFGIFGYIFLVNDSTNGSCQTTYIRKDSGSTSKGSCEQ